MRWLPMILLLGGCDLLFGDIGDTWEPDTSDSDTGVDDSGCPAGMDEPASVDVSVRGFSFNASESAADLATEPWNDVPVACVSADGLSAQVLLAIAGEPAAWVRSNAAQAGTQDLIGGSGLEIEGFGLTPPATWSDGDWSSGRWTVTEQGGTWTHGISAYGTSDSNLIGIELYIDVTP